MRAIVTVCECFFFSFSTFAPKLVGGKVGTSIQVFSLVSCPNHLSSPPSIHF